jgi:hypothetical protein
MSARHSWKRKYKQNKKIYALCIISENVLILNFITKQSRIYYLEEDTLLKYKTIRIPRSENWILSILRIGFEFILQIQLKI